MAWPLLKSETGFTLIELLVAVAVLAIVISFSVVSYQGVQQNSRDSKRWQDLKSIEQLLENYRNKNGGYPPGSDIFALNVFLPGSGTSVQGYLSSIPLDPVLGRNYGYLALPVGCSGNSCTDYTLCAKKEGTKPYPSCGQSTLSCGSNLTCDIGLSSK